MKDWIGYINQNVDTGLWGLVILDYYYKECSLQNPSSFINDVFSKMPTDIVDPVLFHHTLLSVCVHLLGCSYSDIMEKSTNFIKKLKKPMTKDQLSSIISHYDTYRQTDIFREKLDSANLDITNIDKKPDKTDREITEKRSANEKPLAFISHDSRDKDELVRELAKELTSLGCPLWYDDDSLEEGENIRESIENVLKETTHCIIILSPNYLSNKRWAKNEFDLIFELWTNDGKIMLPVLHKVTLDQAKEYCLSLSKIKHYNSVIGVNELALRLSKKVLKK